MDKAHAQALGLVRVAILAIGRLGFRPGMPGYGQELDRALEYQITALHDPNFHAKPVYLMGHLMPKFAAILP